MALVFHPDVTGNDNQKAENFKKISEAYKTLTNDAERSKYDQMIGNRRINYPQSNSSYTSQRSKARPLARPPTPGEFNYAMWKAWHYGENAVKAPSTPKVDLGAHQRYYAKRQQRERVKKQEEDDLIDEHAKRHEAATNLKKRRDERRQGTESKDVQCSIQ